MQAALLEALVDRTARDTEVSVPVFRTRTRRPVQPPEAGTPSDEPNNLANSYAWADPGNTMAPARATTVILREAIVRRNHHVDETPRPPVDPRSSATIDWVRSQDPGLRLRRLGPDLMEIRGLGRGGRVTLAVDQLMFSVTMEGGASPASLAAALGRRLEGRYIAEIIAETPDSLHVKLRSHT